MLDRQTEALYYPRPLLQPDQIESVLCVAPHPDDEVFGCGGLLTQLAARACRVDTVILSRGEQSGAAAPLAMAQAREQESRSAAQVLGLKPPRFHDFGDRELVYAGALDNNNNESAADKNYVQAAIDAALKGESPETKETRARGCGIAYKSR